MSVQSVLFVHLTFLYGPPPHAPGDLCGAGSPCPHPQALRPASGGVYAELVAPALTDAGAPPCTRVTFVSRRKSPKACQGACPLNPRGGHYHPPSGFAAPPRKGCNSGQHPETKSNCRATD